ncbi:hypothetical protein D3C71_1657220 [compost metagenome]
MGSAIAQREQTGRALDNEVETLAPRVDNGLRAIRPHRIDRRNFRALVKQEIGELAIVIGAAQGDGRLVSRCRVIRIVRA